MFCIASYVALVDYGFHKRSMEWWIALPVVGTEIGNDAPHRDGGTVTETTVSLWDHYGFSVGIQQDLAGVEPQSALGLRRADSAETVDLARPHARDEDMPVVIGAVSPRLQRDHACRRRGLCTIEQQQLHEGSVL